MFDSIFSSGTLKGLEQTVAFAERRHAILAGNLANMDTPDYKTRDLSVDKFQESLKELIAAEKQQAQAASPGMRTQSMPYIPGSPNTVDQNPSQTQAVENVRDAMKQIVYHDGSDDNLEMQVTQISKNQSMHSIAIGLMKSQFRMLQMAISESVNV